jgi:hypothetical protein
MTDDLAAAFGDPGPVHGGRDKKRREVLGQEARIAIQGVNFADQVSAGREVAIPARTYQHTHILACQRVLHGAATWCRDPGVALGGPSSPTPMGQLHGR